MPLLFMDRLPSDFQCSAQLAAIATFMEGSDDDESEKGGVEDEGCARGAPLRQTRKAAARQTRKQAPYAKNKGAKTSSKQAAKELQLYLSMFKM
uniref:Uncharacterized protein n=1 Tax=Globisporangium ultimum (strain ATCC 200006 / CBS 805.95 / DAOM BR144) TaxID=431595 RepID=K3WWT0_GLOUD